MIGRIDLFCEDAAHESWSRALVERLAHDEGVSIAIRVVSGRFGIPRLKKELRAFGRVVQQSSGLPDLLVVVIDANAVGPAARRQEIDEAINLGMFPHVAVGTPDPCVERWFLADPESFAERFASIAVPGPSEDCGAWKAELMRAIEASGEIVTGGGAEFADDVVSAMDLYRAGKASASLKSFTEDIRGALKRLA